MSAQIRSKKSNQGEQEKRDQIIDRVLAHLVRKHGAEKGIKEFRAMSLQQILLLNNDIEQGRAE